MLQRACPCILKNSFISCSRLEAVISAKMFMKCGIVTGSGRQEHPEVPTCLIFYNINKIVHYMLSMICKRLLPLIF